MAANEFESIFLLVYVIERAANYAVMQVRALNIFPYFADLDKQKS